MERPVSRYPEYMATFIPHGKLLVVLMLVICGELYIFESNMLI